MKCNNALGVIVAGCLMVIAFAVVTNPENRSGMLVRATTLHVASVTYTPVEPMPVREVVKVDDQQLECMALNIYFEARNQDTDKAMAAVGFTVLNRVATHTYPNTICDVVYQGQRDSNGNYVRNRCQFSWVCDGKGDVPNMHHPIEAKAWGRAISVAIQVMTGAIANPVGNATMYHATYVLPYWVRSYSLVAQVEGHVFYEKAAKNG